MAKRGEAEARADEANLLDQLIAECGELGERATVATSAYNAKREQVAALLARLHGEGVKVESGGFYAILQRRVQHFIDPAALFKVLKGQRDAFFELVTVPLGAAKAALTPASYADLEKAREADRATLVVRKADATGRDD